MLLDWITARVDLNHCGRPVARALADIGERIMRYCPRTGSVVWESAAWDSVRSDSHQVTVRCGSDAFWIQGSPARAEGDGDAVFGGPASSVLDLRAALAAMVSRVEDELHIPLPSVYVHPFAWHVSRVDVTANLLLSSLSDVRVALRLLRDVEGGRYRVSQQAGDTVYWSHRSRIRAGKCYAKGPQLRYLQKRATAEEGYSGRIYSEAELALSDRLIRPELRLGAQWWRERVGPWWTVKAEQLRAEWEGFFGRMLGGIEVTDMSSIAKRVREVAATDGQARAALGLWALIQAHGWEQARELSSRATWFRNVRVLRAAGLGDADISVGRVVELRRRVLVVDQVDSWAELKRRAA